MAMTATTTGDMTSPGTCSSAATLGSRRGARWECGAAAETSFRRRCRHAGSRFRRCRPSGSGAPRPEVWAAPWGNPGSPAAAETTTECSADDLRRPPGPCRAPGWAACTRTSVATRLTTGAATPGPGWGGPRPPGDTPPIRLSFYLLRVMLAILVPFRTKRRSRLNYYCAYVCKLDHVYIIMIFFIKVMY